MKRENKIESTVNDLDKWNSTTFRDSVLQGLLFSFILLSSSTTSSVLNVKKTHSQILGLRDILVRQEKLDQSFAQ